VWLLSGALVQWIRRVIPPHRDLLRRSEREYVFVKCVCDCPGARRGGERLPASVVATRSRPCRAQHWPWSFPGPSSVLGKGSVPGTRGSDRGISGCLLNSLPATMLRPLAAGSVSGVHASAPLPQGLANASGSPFALVEAARSPPVQVGIPLSSGTDMAACSSRRWSWGEYCARPVDGGEVDGRL
jgi:hypothetical protein